MAEGSVLSVKKHKHFESTQVVLKLKETQDTNVRQPTQRWRFRATGCDLRGCADSAGVSDSLPTGEPRTHNPLVLGSNPSGPTNQPIEAAAVRKIGATDCRSSTGQLKLFSQL